MFGAFVIQHSACACGGGGDGVSFTQSPPQPSRRLRAAESGGGVCECIKAHGAAATERPLILGAIYASARQPIALTNDTHALLACAARMASHRAVVE